MSVTSINAAARNQPRPQWTVRELVEACLDGDQRAWSLLIRRYKSLICSFARRYGARGDDVSEVFQLVCAELFRALPRLRDHESVGAWITTVASHQAYRWKRRHARRIEHECGTPDETERAIHSEVGCALEHAERDRLVRDAIAKLAPRDQQVVEMLFYEDPPVPYEIAAARLGLASTSIGPIRGRCLRRLEQILKGVGVV